jgi:hypothetical protein
MHVQCTCIVFTLPFRSRQSTLAVMAAARILLLAATIASVAVQVHAQFAAKPSTEIQQVTIEPGAYTRMHYCTINIFCNEYMY